MVTAGLLLAASATAQAPFGRNLLTDPGFETGIDIEQFDPAWEKSGNVFHELATPRSGSWTAKLFGNFTGSTNQASLSQTVAIQPAARYKAGLFMRHNSDDALQGDNSAWVQLDFLNAEGKVLGSVPSARFTAKHAPDRFERLETRPMMAPFGATRARFQIVFDQPGDAPGAVFCDDASLERTP
jgi:hypothetical protein